nr:zinc carboxypeptidase-like [Maniola hyperantus]
MYFRVVFAVLSITVAIAAKRSYKGYSVIKVTPKTSDDIATLDEIRTKGVGEFWDDQFYINYEARIMVLKDNRKRFNDLIEKSSMESEELIKDLQGAIDEQMIPAQRSSSSETFLGMTWNQYYNLDEINQWLDEVAKTYPTIVTPIVMGKSFEDRDIKGVIIRYRPRTNSTRPLIGMLEGALHAREWITPATITWIVKEFLTSRDREIRALAENLEWHIFPVVNPDGYNYTFTTNRMWRKNRSTRNFTSCAASGVADDMSNGIDLNRNFDSVWMSIGASDNPCSNTFAGPVAFSEPESRAISTYVDRLNAEGRMIYYYSFHSYTQLFIIPFSHVSGQDVLLAENYADMYEIAIRGAEHVFRKYSTTYRVGVSADVLYPMSGTSFDWVKNATNIPVSLLIELRDLGQYGFLLPPEQIIPNSLEIMDALVVMDNTTRSLGYYSYSGTNSIVCSFVIVVFSVIMSLLY